MSPELQRIMQDQLDAFKKKFGRAPGPNDPVFFDPDAKTPQLFAFCDPRFRCSRPLVILLRAGVSEVMTMPTG